MIGYVGLKLKKRLLEASERMRLHRRVCSRTEGAPSTEPLGAPQFKGQAEEEEAAKEKLAKERLAR